MNSHFIYKKHPEYQLFSTTEGWIDCLVQDIKQAKHYIYIETFKFNDDAAGEKVCDALIHQANKGLDIKIIVDSWGTRHSALLVKMQKQGIAVRFFKKIVFSVNLFSKNHKRNHRKIIAIDNNISYIGSANFTEYSYKWRESMLRIQQCDLTETFKHIFLENFKIYKKQIRKRKYYKTITLKNFKIIRETPSIIHQKSRNYFMKLIDHAKESIDIITPYFLAGQPIIDKLGKAVKRGVQVRLIIPKHSDVRSIDFLRDLFLGVLYKKGIKIEFFQKGNIHAKLMLIDRHIFSIGSTNFDYRSFRYMHEINLSGENSVINDLIAEYIEDTLTECEPFCYVKWIERPLHQKIIGILLYPVRKLI
jgi:cardiolipin synthase